MKTKRIQFTVEIEDNDLIEFTLIKQVRGLLGDSLKNYQVFFLFFPFCTVTVLPHTTKFSILASFPLR
mgnify:CR=1 FL=1